jgi:hypothetical protein
MLRTTSCLGYEDGNKEEMANGWCGCLEDDKAKEVPTVAEVTKTTYKTTRFRTITLTKQQHDWTEELGIRFRFRPRVVVVVVVVAGRELDNGRPGCCRRRESAILYLVGSSIAMLSPCFGSSKTSKMDANV